jgi:hypothetical protein
MIGLLDQPTLFGGGAVSETLQRPAGLAAKRSIAAQFFRDGTDFVAKPGLGLI